MNQCGDEANDVVVKSDQELAIKMSMEQLTQGREEGRTHVEESPVGSSGSNGIVEERSSGWKVR
jgi:hypothetical protein